MCQPCPKCGEPALARIRTKDSDEINVGVLYRHTYYGTVYLHEIDYGKE